MSMWHNADGTLDPVKVRAEYPIFTSQPGGRPLHYLDSAATGQRPQRVVDALSKYLFTANANPHRGAYTLAQMATDGYEAARARIAAYVNVPASELVMLGSATEALNLVARSWGKRTCVAVTWCWLPRRSITPISSRGSRSPVRWMLTLNSSPSTT